MDPYIVIKLFNADGSSTGIGIVWHYMTQDIWWLIAQMKAFFGTG